VTRLLRYPLLALAFLALWLLLVESVSPGAILLGVVLAVAGSGVLAALGLPRGRLGGVLAVPRLLLDVLVEIVRSNNAVARIILQPREPGGRRSGFVHIPLDMRNPYGLSALACILTATPGTVWVDYDARSGTMLLHVLDLVDEETWVRTIKDKWERRLMEIFE
jgi:multicomponent K+:H+ antiporter subunit E